jgi:hypothetical protein
MDVIPVPALLTVQAARKWLQDADDALARARDAVRNCCPTSRRYGHLQATVQLAEEELTAARNAFRESMRTRMGL